MIKLLTVKSELNSAKRLGFPTFVTDTFRTDQFNPSKDILIRWGNSRVFPELNLKGVINPSRAIQLNVDKYSSLIELSKVVLTPKLYAPYSQIPSGVKVVVRPVEHTGGEGFEIKTGPFDLDEEEYALDFIDSKLEYRVWFCGNLTMCAQRVALEGKNDPSELCRANWGYSYRPMRKDLRDQTLKAAKQIGLHCGAADIIIKGKKNYFLELNSAPSIDTNTLERFYRDGINKLVINPRP